MSYRDRRKQFLSEKRIERQVSDVPAPVPAVQRVECCDETVNERMNNTYLQVLAWDVWQKPIK